MSLAQELDFTGQTAIITGASGGIGAATARAFYGQGANVVIVDRDADGLEQIHSSLNDDHRILAVAADVTDDAAVADYVSQAHRRFGSVDVLFNNAGIDGTVARIEDMTPEQFDDVIAVNLRSVWLGMHHALPIMYRQGSGVVVNTASIASYIAGPSPMAPYVASKHAVRGLTHMAAREAAEHNVRVVSVSPAQVDTDLMRRIEAERNPEDPEAARRQYEAGLPLGRYARPEDVAYMVVFLASKAAGYSTSSDYLVDGGRLA